MTKIYREGEVMDMTEAEETEAEQSVLEQLKAFVERPFDTQYKLELLADAIPVMAKPAEREGYVSIPYFDFPQMAFAWMELKNPYFSGEADGTEESPFTFAEDVPVVPGLWYTDGTNTWECIMAGFPSSFSDYNFFRIPEEFW